MRDAVLLIGHGSVESESDIPQFVANIRRGRPTPQSIVDEVTHRWKAIGGSPLLRITQAQAAALQSRLGIPVVVGMRLFHPYAKDVVEDLAKRDISRVISLPLAPYSVHIYNETTHEACAAAGVSCVVVPPWGENPALLEAFAVTTRKAIDTLPVDRRDAAHVVLTAHSLPTRIIREGDPYEGQVKATAAAVMRTLGAKNSYRVAFQSQGMDGGEWLGPDLKTTFDALHHEGVHDVVVTAIGFLADHTEVLYDLDVEARAMAEKLGLSFTRAASLNDDPRLIDALESIARDAMTAV